MKAKKPTGRPSLQTPEMESEILSRLAAGETLRGICQSEGIPPHSTVLGWVNEDPLFADRYARARSMGLDVMAEEIIEIADESSRDTIETAMGTKVPDSEWISRSRLRVDARKWLLSKMRPDKYGERTAVDLKADVTVGVMSLAETLEARRQKRLKAGGLVESVEGQREGGESSTTQY